MENEDKLVEKVEVRRMVGVPVLTEVDGIFRKIDLGSRNRRTVVYKTVKPFGFGMSMYSVGIEPHFNSKNSGLDYQA